MDVIDSLKEFGLSEKEAKTYLACLELGDATANDISLKSDIARTLTYDVLERLIDLGFISYTIKDNMKYFSAASPQEFMRVLKEKESAISNILPSLNRLRGKGSKRPKVKIYEGKEGMKTIMNDILRANVKEFLAYGSSRSSYDLIPAFMEEWHAERAKKKIVMKILYNNTADARNRLKQYTQSLKYTRYRFMPVVLESPTATLIYGNKVILQSWTKDPFAVMIEDEQMAQNQRKYFEELWKIGTP